MNMEKLRQAAVKEDWEFIDSKIPEICNDPSAIASAKKWLFDQDGNVRDLAASILEKTNQDINPMKTKLYAIIKADPHPYARFRSACALAAHGEKTNVIKTTLSEFKEDPDVADIAKQYLARLK
jgi:hypothetical protein